MVGMAMCHQHDTLLRALSRMWDLGYNDSLALIMGTTHHFSRAPMAAGRPHSQILMAAKEAQEGEETNYSLKVPEVQGDRHSTLHT
jgi:hypothetical protein